MLCSCSFRVFGLVWPEFLRFEFRLATTDAQLSSNIPLPFKLSVHCNNCTITLDLCHWKKKCPFGPANSSYCWRVPVCQIAVQVPCFSFSLVASSLRLFQTTLLVPVFRLTTGLSLDRLFDRSPTALPNVSPFRPLPRYLIRDLLLLITNTFIASIPRSKKWRKAAALKSVKNRADRRTAEAGLAGDQRTSPLGPLPPR